MAGAGRKDWTPGATVAATDMDQYLQEQTVMQFASSAARDTALSAILDEGLLTTQADSNCMTAYSGAAWSTIGPLWGAWTTWTPAVTQGATPTLTATGSAYCRFGRLVIARINVAITSSGTAANDVVISLPVSAAGGSTTYLTGTVVIEDGSASTRYVGTGLMTAATTFKLIPGTSAGTTLFLGSSTFTAALTTGDFIYGTIMYEAAADA